MNAENSEEVQQILKQNGYEVSSERSRIILEIAKEHAESEQLSMDELSAVSGGAETRDYATQGCAATVENGSRCWGTDGGCWSANIDYDHEPMTRACPRCGAHTFYMAKQDYYSDLRSMYGCRNCGLYAAGFDVFVSPFWEK